MFTGIIQKTGVIKGLQKKKDVYRLIIHAESGLGPVAAGDSVCVNGACLTAVKAGESDLTFDIMEHTFKGTSFRSLKNNDVVNLERAIKAESRLEGHFVLGHVDTIGKIKKIEKHVRPFIEVTILPDDRKYVVMRGSIAIGGISLTVAEVYRDSIRVYVIPHTLQNTNLQYRKISDEVNIEFDILGKYIENYVIYGKEKKEPVTEDFLKRKGFI